MKKEIVVLTFHKAVSYGAAYQTYALQTYLNGIGYDVKIVDYIPPRFTTFNSIFSMPANGNKVKKIIKFIPYVLSKATSVYMLQRFNKKYLTKVRDHIIMIGNQTRRVLTLKYVDCQKEV